jgi:hypothetical protein
VGCSYLQQVLHIVSKGFSRYMHMKLAFNAMYSRYNSTTGEPISLKIQCTEDFSIWSLDFQNESIKQMLYNSYYHQLTARSHYCRCYNSLKLT